MCYTVTAILHPCLQCPHVCTVEDKPNGSPMSDITLQKYLAKLEDFLQQQRNDEVVQHSRHILRSFPRNVNAYRLLGSALLASGRYDDAERALRRVLTVYPADTSAHLGLSRLAENRKDGAAAIWHLERAYEQDPANASIQEALRDGYRQHRKTELTRLPLTARLIASQQISSGLYPKAISTLRTALNQLPTRVDLQVLLAQALWEAGYEIESGETAMQVLKHLPESLEANEILTRLWLRQGRPSDAQRYLSRIEAVDPLYAFEVAQGTPAPDNVFRLTEFDYQLEANRQLVSDSPDWLESLGASDDGSDSDEAQYAIDVEDDDADITGDSSVSAVGAGGNEDWLTAAFAIDDDDDDGDTDDTANADQLDDTWASDWGAPAEDTGALGDTAAAASSPQTGSAVPSANNDDDWLGMLDDIPASASQPTRQVEPDDLFGDLGDVQDFDQLLDEVDNEWLTQIDASAAPDVSALPPSDRTGLTGLLSTLDEPPRGSTGLTGLLDSLEDPSEEISTDELAPGSKADDWMRDVNKPTARLDLPFAQEFEPVDDSLSWLSTPAEEVELPEPEEYDPNDSLAWMRRTGIEFMPDAPASAFDEAVAAEANEEQGPVVDPHSDNPLAWAQGLGVEFIEADSDEALQAALLADTAGPVDIGDTGDSADADEEDPLAWMAAAGIQWTDSEEPTTDPSPGNHPQQNRVGQAQQDEDTALLPNRRSTPDTSPDLSFQFADDADISDDTDSHAVTGITDDAFADTGFADDAFSDQAFSGSDLSDDAPWGTQDRLTFTEQDGQGAMNDDNNDRTPDWLSSSGNASGDDDDFGDDLFGAEASDSDELDWLNMLDEDEAQPAETSGSSSAARQPDAFDDSFSELDQLLGLDAVPEQPAEENLPDWLLSSRPDETSEPAGASGFNADAFNDAFGDPSLEDELEKAWNLETPSDELDLTEDDFEVGIDGGVAEEEAMPDWLTSLAPSTASPPDDDMSSLFGDSNAAASDAGLNFDWETEYETSDAGQPDTLAPAASSAAPSFMASFDDDQTDADDEEAMPDWLSGLEPTTSTESDSQPVSDFGSDFGSTYVDSYGSYSTEQDEPGDEFAFEDRFTASAADAGAASGTEDEDALFTMDTIPGDLIDEDRDAFIRSQIEVATGEHAAVFDAQSSDQPSDQQSDSSAWTFDTEDDAQPLPYLTPDETAPAYDDASGFNPEDDLLVAAALSAGSSSGSFSDYDANASDTSAADEAEEEFTFNFADSDNLDVEPETASDEQLPDWLLEIREPDEAEASTSTAASSQAFADDADEAADIDEMPDWLQSAAPSQASSTADELSFDSFNADFDTDDTALEDELSWELEDDAQPAASGTPDWLSGFSGSTSDTVDAEDDEEAFDFDSLGIGDSQPAMDASVTDNAGTDFDEFVAEYDDPDSQPSWLTALDPIEDDAPAAHTIDHLETVRDAVSEDFDEEDQGDLSFLENTVSDGETLDRELDWMLEDDEEEPEFVAQFGDLPRLDLADDADAEEPFSLGSGDFDSSDFDLGDFDSADEDLAAAEISSGYSDFGSDAGTDALRSLELTDEIEPVPASNAPDWLNAMVPGLDLDYEVDGAEDEFSDEVFAASDNETSASGGSTGGYDWLTEIVEEELRPPVTMPEPVRPTSETAAAPLEGSRQRFSFDRAPLWLRRLKDKATGTSGTSDLDDSSAGVSGSGAASAGAIGAAGAAGLMVDDFDLDDSDLDDFDDDLFDDEVFNSADLADADFDLGEEELDDFDQGFLGADFDPDDEFDPDDADETDLPPWLRLDGDE